MRSRAAFRGKAAVRCATGFSARMVGRKVGESSTDSYCRILAGFLTSRKVDGESVRIGG